MGDADGSPTKPFVEPLTRRERDVLALLAEGLTGPEIAEKLTLATSSVKTHIQHLYGKLGVNGKRQALDRARELGLLNASSLSPAAVASPAARHVPRHNLPLQVTKIIGREGEIVRIRRRLAEHRLVTLVGSGGVGKTRLSSQVAQELVDEFADGVWFVGLAPLTDPALVAQTVAASVGLRDEPGRPILDTLADFLRPRQVLLVLDNCEHLLEACAHLTDSLLRHCPRVTILTSSREPLGIEGEAVVAVPSLAFPVAGTSVQAEELAAFAAVRLFTDRVHMSLPEFAITANNAHAVARICQRLDGVPLALELAASRLRFLDTETLAARLDDAFGLLTGGNRTALPRQQTLRATMDWSYNLLSPAERLLLQRLSAFAGGCTLEAAEVVCAGDGLEPGQVLEALAALLDKSMVRAERKSDQATRYYLLETVRQYAREKINEAGDSRRLHSRHLDFYLAFAELAAPQLTGALQQTQLDGLEADHDNLRAALEWSITAGETELALRMACALWRFWFLRGYLVEAETWLQRVLELPGSSPHSRAGALVGFGFIALFRGKLNQTARWATEGLALAREAGDQRLAANSLSLLGDLNQIRGDRATAALLLADGLAAARESGDAWTLAFALAELAQVPSFPDDAAEETAAGVKSVALARVVGDRWLLAFSLFRLGNLATYRKDFATAQKLHEEGLALRRELGDRLGMAYALLGLGEAAFAQGDVAEGLARFEERLALELEVGNREGATAVLRDMAVQAWLLGDAARADALWQEFDAACEAIGHTFGAWAMLTNQFAISLAMGNYIQAREQALAVPKISGAAPREKGSVAVRLGQVEYLQGHLAEAQPHFEAARRIFRELNDQNGMGWAPPWLGCVAYRVGDLDLAQELVEEGLAIHDPDGFWPELAFALLVYGDVARAQGHISVAADSYARSLKIVVEHHDQPDVAERLEGFAKLAGAAHQPQRAARLYGAAEALRDRIGLPIPPVERADYDGAVGLVRAQLASDDFNVVWAEGKAMSWEQAAAYALEVQPAAH